MNKLSNFKSLDENIQDVFSPIDFQSIEFSNSPNSFLGLNSFFSPGKLINPGDNNLLAKSIETEENEVPVIKKFKCDYENCCRSYTTIGNLKTHQKQHTGNYTFICKLEGCNKSFVSSYALKIHTRSHTNERPYSCIQPGCHKSFTTSYKLKQHEALHTKCSYKCENCGFNFNTKQALSFHQKFLTCANINNKNVPELEIDKNKFLSSDKIVDVETMETEAAQMCEGAMMPSCCDSNVIASQVMNSLSNKPPTEKCCGMNKCSMVETRSLSIICSCCRCPQSCCQGDKSIQKKCPAEPSISNVSNIINNLTSGMALKEITQHMREDNGQISLVIQLVIGVPQLQ